MSDEKIVELEKRVEKLEAEIVELKRNNKEFSPNPTPTKTKPIQKSPERKAAVSKEIDWEKEIGQIWLPRIFIIVLLLGVIWGFKAAIDGGFVTEPIRVILGFLTAGAFLFVGEKQVHKDRGKLGLVLIGGSITMMILTTFAAHALYGFISAPVSFILNILWIVVGLYLVNRHKSQELGVFVGIAGYLVPFLISSENPNIYVFIGYEFLLFMTLLGYSLRNKYKSLFYVSILLLHITYMAYMILGSSLSTGKLFETKLIAIALLLQHFVLLGSLFKKNVFGKHQIGLLFSTFVASLIWSEKGFSRKVVSNGEYDEYVTYINEFGTTFDYLLLGQFVFYAVLAFIVFTKKIMNKELSVFTSIATFALMILFLEITNIDNFVGILMLIQAAISIYIGFKLKSLLQIATGTVVLFFGIFSTIFEKIDDVFSVETLSWLVMISVMLYLYKLISSDTWWGGRGKNKVIVGVVISILLGIFIFLTQVTAAAVDGFSHSVQKMSVSFVWALYSILGVLYGVKMNVRKIRLFGIAMIFVTLLKLVFYDFPSVSIVIRALLFIVLGLLGILMSRIFYNKNERDK